MQGLDEVRRGAERVRVGAWRGEQAVACLAPTGSPPLSEAMVRHTCRVLARHGYREVLTSALAPDEQAGFLAAGFEVRDTLHLLAHDLHEIPPSPPSHLRRGRRRDRPAALALDALAFPPFWRLDDAGLQDAITATSAARFRVSAPAGAVRGYAVTGRSGRRGYVQRLAVDPACWGQGLGRSLVLDALRWLHRWACVSAVVNTQVDNERAVRLYEGLGFRRQPSGLVVLGRALADHQPAT